MSEKRCAIWGRWLRKRDDYWNGVQKPTEPVLVVCARTARDGKRLCSMLNPTWGGQVELVPYTKKWADDKLRGFALARDRAGSLHKQLVADARHFAKDSGIALVELAQVGGERTKATTSDAILPRAQKAGQQYQQAADALGGTPTDREVYDALEKAHKQAGEASDLPSFPTWQRYVREWRKVTKQQKKTPRAGRAHPSGGLVPYDQLEREQLPESVRPQWVDEGGRGADE